MSKITKEKTCAFYASDYHFEMISLPFIEKKLQEDKKVIVLTENNLEDTMKFLMSKINLKQEKKEEISKINWKNNDLEKFKEIKENVDRNKDLIIFIKGKENYIKNVNKNIEKWTENKANVKIIDCYDLEELGSSISIVKNEYQNVLNTTGETKIENL